MTDETAKPDFKAFVQCDNCGDASVWRFPYGTYLEGGIANTLCGNCGAINTMRRVIPAVCWNATTVCYHDVLQGEPQ